MEPLARDDPNYVDQLEAALSLMFVPLAALDMGAVGIAAETGRMAVDTCSLLVMRVLQHHTGLPPSPVMQAWLSSRHAERN